MSYPTKSQLEYLVTECTWEYTESNLGTAGYFVSSGSNIIFLPLSGYYQKDKLYDFNKVAYYWCTDDDNVINCLALDKYNKSFIKCNESYSNVIRSISSSSSKNTITINGVHWNKFNDGASLEIQTGDFYKYNELTASYYCLKTNGGSGGVDMSTIKSELGINAEQYNGNAATATNVAWSGVTNKPTTLSGYGITDGVNSSDVVTTATANKILKLNSNSKLPASITGSATSATNDSDGNQINNTYLKLSGGKMTGPLTWTNTSALPEFSDKPKYLLGIDAFADGGTTKWKDVNNIKVGGATLSDKSDLLKFLHGNEINFLDGGSLQTNVWFNYRRSYTDDVYGSDTTVNYKFGNYNKKTINAVLHAGSAIFSATNNISPSEKLHIEGGNIKISSSNTGSGGDVYLTLWRGTNASWRILNTGGNLKLQSNWTTALQSSYHDLLSLSYGTTTTATITGNITATAEVTAYSDRRLKSNITPLRECEYITPVEYDKDDKHCIGFIAQDVQEKYPELVQENKEGILSLNYAQYTAVLQQQIIQLKAEIDLLKEFIKNK